MEEIKLNAVRKVSINRLKSNPFAKKFFRPTDGAQTDWLYNDIKKRGIIDPLIAKKDGVLLTGHRRLAIARQLKLTTVPVRFIDSTLSKEEEIQFLIRDNVLRRHLTPTERKKYYRFLIPDFDEKLENTNSKTMGINQKELAEKSGINERTVGYDLSRMRHEAKKKRNQEAAVDIPDEKAVFAYKKACAHMLNIAILGSVATLQEFKNIHKSTAERLEGITH